jgi:hypothetical protein
LPEGSNWLYELKLDQIRGFTPGFAYRAEYFTPAALPICRRSSAASYSNAIALTALVAFASTALVASLRPEKKE